MTREPPTVPNGSACDEYELAPGVHGYAVEHAGAIYIPVIHAQREGAGAVGRFLDSLSSRCRIPNVVSPQLAGMLQRRGWKAQTEETELGPIDVWTKENP